MQLKGGLNSGTHYVIYILFIFTRLIPREIAVAIFRYVHLSWWFTCQKHVRVVRAVVAEK